MTNTLTEEKLIYICGGTEGRANGLGGAERIKEGDKVIWNGQSDLGIGTVIAITFDFAVVTFQTLYGPHDYVIEVNELSLVH